MTASEAAIQAYKRDKIEKILLATGAVSIAVATAYGIKAYKEYNLDDLIKSGVELTRVSTSDTAGVRDGFYAAFSKNKMDVNKYAGYYADQIKRGIYNPLNKGTDVFKKELSATDDIKIASPKSATNTLRELASVDPAFQKQLRLLIRDAYYNDFSGSPVYEKAFESIYKDKIDKNVYDVINRSLTSDTNVRDKFYEALKNKGYGAIVDVNDQKYSGFASKKPIIVFDAAKIAVKKVEKLSTQEIKSRKGKAIVDMGAKAIAKELPKSMALPVSTAIGVNILKSKNNDRIVREYRSKHPNTNLSYEEIVRNYRRQILA